MEDREITTSLLFGFRIQMLYKKPPRHDCVVRGGGGCVVGVKPESTQVFPLSQGSWSERGTRMRKFQAELVFQIRGIHDPFQFRGAKQ
jgi:hypothetical protein